MNGFFEFFLNTMAGGFILAMLGFTMLIGLRKHSDSVKEDLAGYISCFGFIAIGIGVLGCKIYQHFYY